MFKLGYGLNFENLIYFLKYSKLVEFNNPEISQKTRFFND